MTWLSCWQAWERSSRGYPQGICRRGLPRSRSRDAAELVVAEYRAGAD